MSIRIRLNTAGAVTALAIAPVALHSQTSSRAEVLADSSFIREALNGNLLEIRLGTAARSKASNGAVKDLAQRMVTDHTSMWKQWDALAKKNGLPSDVGSDVAGKATADQLSTLSGADFDRAYMSEMVRDHQADIAKFQQAASSADAADVRQLAANEVPVMQQHLTLAEQVASQVGATTVATSPVGASPTQPQPPVPGGKVPLPTQPQPPVPAGKVPLPPPAGSQADRSRNQGGDRDLTEADRQYANEVAVGHLMEVRLAEMAQRKARDPDVKRFSERLHDDFEKWLPRWSALAGKEPHMGPLHQEKIERLEKASAKQFDRTYLDIVTENLGSMVPYFQKEGRAAHSARVRDMVKEELSTLQQNLQTAERLEKGKNPSLSSNK